jgi:competence ComEA-like helix-hairpin-helix protein
LASLQAFHEITPYMALFSFGKKDKNPPEPPVAVAKAPPTPPKIQNPPPTVSMPGVKPPQPSGLMPSVGLTASVATTQPMVMPRPAGNPARTSRTAATGAPRSTQRIVVPTNATGQVSGTRVMPPVPTGRINLPIGMILRCLPPEVLAADIAEFDASGAAATEVGLPMNLVLSQLPSGKVEMTLQELVPHLPAGFLQPTESITRYLPTLVNLPLMDVVMRIPPDLLALRPDQKDVDASVINMADPFTEEILREQAAAAAAASAQAPTPAPATTQTNIIDESQVPSTEEFVPRDQVRPTKSFVPPSRIAPSGSLPTVKTPPSLPTVKAPPAIPGTQPAPILGASKLPGAPVFPRAAGSPPMPTVVRANTPVPPSAPNASSRTISPATTRPPAAITLPVPLPPPAKAATAAAPQAIPMPPPPRPSGALPPNPQAAPSAPAPQVPPTLRTPATPPTFSAPALPGMPSLVETPATPSPAPAAAAAPSASSTPPSASAPSTTPPAAAGAFPSPGQPDAAADELKRLAALAEAELGEKPEAPDAKESAPVPAPTDSAPKAPTVVLPPPSAPPVPESIFATTQPMTPPAAAPAPTTTARVASPSFQAPAASPAPAAAQPAAKDADAKAAPAGDPSMALNLNSCTIDELLHIPGCTPLLAESIVRYRTRMGAFKKIEDLLEVPGMNSAAYSNLTGEAPPTAGVTPALGDLLGFPPDQKVTLKDVTDRICCWPDVTGCVLSQSSGLVLVGTVPKELDKNAIVAFAPRMFEAINKSFGEIAGKETDELIIPTTGTSFHIFRNHDLFLIILARLPQMPDRHAKIARMVLAGLSLSPA